MRMIRTARKVLTVLVVLLFVFGLGCTPLSTDGSGGGGGESGASTNPTNPGEHDTRLEAPNNLSAQVITHTSAFVTWGYMEVTGAEWLTRFRVYLSSNDVDYDFLAPVDSGLYKAYPTKNGVRVKSREAVDITVNRSLDSQGRVISYTHVFFEGLVPETEYTVGVTAVKVEASDVDATIESSESARLSIEFTTLEIPEVPDTTPPADVSALTVDEAESGTVRLSWINPTDDDFERVVVRRQESVPPADPFSGKSMFGGDWAITYLTDTGLKEDGTVYWYTVFTYDTTGNHSPGVSVSAIPLDTLPPDPPKFVRLNLCSHTRVELQLYFGLDESVVKMLIYRAGDTVPLEEYVDPNKASIFCDTDLTPNTTYSYEVSYVDDYGNESERFLYEATTASDETRVYVANNSRMDIAPDGTGTGYSIFYEDGRIATSDCAGRSYFMFKVLGDLSADTFRVFPMTYGAYGDIFSFETDELMGVPPEPYYASRFDWRTPAGMDVFDGVTVPVVFVQDGAVDTQTKNLFIATQVDLDYGNGAEDWVSQNVIFRLDYENLTYGRFTALDAYVLEDIPKTNGQFLAPRAIDPPTNIIKVENLLYVFMGESGRVFIIDVDTGVKTEYTLQGVEDSVHIEDVELSSNGNFYASDSANACIYVIDSATLSVLRTFGPDELGNSYIPYGLDEDTTTGYLWSANGYVVDGENNTIRVLDPSNIDTPIVREVTLNSAYPSFDVGVDPENGKAYFSHPFLRLDVSMNYRFRDVNNTVSIVSTDTYDVTTTQTELYVPYKITVLKPQ